jgi:2-polyprenyl-3-methyl-5-hydroxy-6-metoxy-1,4-benzoquinol methylase
MSEREYQHNFSRMVDGAMYNLQARERKARTILAVLQDFFGKTSLSSISLLDVGSSTGIIDNYLADHFGEVIGVDIDKEAIQFAQDSFQKNNLKFMVDDLMGLNFSDNTFDVIVCTQIYEHVPDAQTMMKEIFRVLKPGGICYFAAGNRISVMEPHYRLPFLSIIPRPLAHIYMKVTGKGSYYHEKHLTLSGLQKLARSFIVHDYTKKIISDPINFHSEYMLKPGSTKHKLSISVANYAYWLCPSYIWILEKPSIR